MAEKLGLQLPGKSTNCGMFENKEMTKISGPKGEWRILHNWAF
jgi:hypothetical protein